MTGDAPSHAYRSFKPCGCVGLVAVDCPEMQEDNATEVAAAIRAGYHIERVTLDEVRQGPFGRCSEHEGT